MLLQLLCIPPPSLCQIVDCIKLGSSFVLGGGTVIGVIMAVVVWQNRYFACRKSQGQSEDLNWERILPELLESGTGLNGPRV